MSATPEEIAEWLCDFARYMRLASPEGDPFSNARLTKAATLIRAQAERVRVLESALSGLFARLDHPGNGGQHVNYFLRWPEVEAARAAIAKAVGEYVP